MPTQAAALVLLAFTGTIQETLARIEQLERSQRSVEASVEMRRLVAANPSHPAVLRAWASQLLSLDRDPAAAEKALTRITEVIPRDPEAWALLGSFYLDRNRAEEAIRCFDRASRMAPEKPVYLAGLARGYAATGREADAHKLFERAAVPGAPAIVFEWHGDVLAEAGQLEEALAAFRRAGNSGPLLLKRAALEITAGAHSDAERDILEARRQGASDRETHAMLARLYAAMGREKDSQKSAAAADAAARSEEERRARWREAKAALERADRFMNEGRFAEAAPWFVAATAAAPDYAEGWFGLGVCRMQTGEAGGAEASLREYVRRRPLSADGHSALGLALAAQGKTAEARAELSRALELDPGLSETREALQSLDSR